MSAGNESKGGGWASLTRGLFGGIFCIIARCFKRAYDVDVQMVVYIDDHPDNEYNDAFFIEVLH